jgi:hypothetical protein
MSGYVGFVPGPGLGNQASTRLQRKMYITSGTATCLRFRGCGCHALQAAVHHDEP